MAKGPILQETQGIWTTPASLLVKRPPTILDYAERHGISGATVLYTYPVPAARLVVFDFSAAISRDDGVADSAMYKIMSRFRRTAAGSTTAVATVKAVESETNASMDVDFNISGNDVQIVGTPNGSADWFFRLYGYIFELPLPVAP